MPEGLQSTQPDLAVAREGARRAIQQRFGAPTAIEEQPAAPTSEPTATSAPAQPGKLKRFFTRILKSGGQAEQPAPPSPQAVPARPSPAELEAKRDRILAARETAARNGFTVDQNTLHAQDEELANLDSQIELLKQDTPEDRAVAEVEAQTRVPLTEPQRRSLRERLTSALNFRVPLIGKAAKDLLIEGGVGAIAGFSVKTAVRSGLVTLGAASSLGVAVGIGAAGGTATAVAKELIRIKRESVKEDYQKRMAEIRERHKETRNAFKREIAVRWEAGQIQRVALAGLRGGVTGAVGGAIGFELGNVAWGDTPVIGGLLAKAEEAGAAGEIAKETKKTISSTITPSVPPQTGAIAGEIKNAVTSPLAPSMPTDGNWTFGHPVVASEGEINNSSVPSMPTEATYWGSQQPVVASEGEINNSSVPSMPTEATYGSLGTKPDILDTPSSRVPDPLAQAQNKLADIQRSLAAGGDTTALQSQLNELAQQLEDAKNVTAPRPGVVSAAAEIPAGIVPQDGMISLPQGSSPWEEARKLSSSIWNTPVDSNDPRLIEITQKMLQKSAGLAGANGQIQPGIRVPGWPLTQGDGFTLDERKIPVGYKLKVDDEVLGLIKKLKK